jgi:hypothetical protein
MKPVRQYAAGTSDRDKEDRPEDGVDVATTTLQHRVMCRVETRQMEVLVGSAMPRFVTAYLEAQLSV